MGLLQAGIGALSGVLADQWREYFYCDSMPENVLMTKGVKRTGSRNANTKGCLLYTSDAADDTPCVDLGGRRIIKKIFFSSRRRHTRY